MSPPRSAARKCLSDTASEPPSSFHPLLLPAAGFASRARRSPNVAKREARGSRARRGATPGTPAPGTVTPGPPTPRTPAPKDPGPGAGMLRDREQPGLRVVMARPGAFPRLVQPTGSCPARGSPPQASARSRGDPKINPAGLRGREGRRREGEEGSAPPPPPSTPRARSPGDFKLHLLLRSLPPLLSFLAAAINEALSAPRGLHGHAAGDGLFGTPESHGCLFWVVLLPFQAGWFVLFVCSVAFPSSPPPPPFLLRDIEKVCAVLETTPPA